MRNWLGQDIEPGDFVGHSCNQYGDMEIGKVFALSGRTARVYWLFVASATPGGRRKTFEKRTGVPPGGGPINVDRLLLLDVSSFDFDPESWWTGE